MHNRWLLFMIGIVFLFLTACGTISTDTGAGDQYPEKMNVDEKEVDYNQEVIDIVNRTDLPAVKLAIEPNQEAKYVIKVDDETYKVMNIPGVNSPIVQIFNGTEIQHQFEFSKNDYHKLTKILVK